MGGGVGAAATGGLGDLGSAYIAGEAGKSQAETNKTAQTDVAKINAQIAANQLEFAKKTYGEQSSAYKQAYKKAQESANQLGDLNPRYMSAQSDIAGGYSNLGQNLQSGYSNAIQQAGQTPEEILQLKRDIESGSAKTLTQGRNQLAAALATQGVRGGQAATQMRRGIGEQTEAATENVNQLMASIANQNKAYQQALMSGQLQSQQQLGTQGLASQQALAQQQLSGQEAYKQALQAFLNNPESAKYAI